MDNLPPKNGDARPKREKAQRPSQRQAEATSAVSLAVTQHDIARISGVSQSVVSRVLGGGGYVSDTAKAKVMKAAAKVGYLPDAGARALVTGTSNVIAIAAANVTNSFYPYLLDRLSMAVQTHGREIMLFNAPGGRDVDTLLPGVLTYRIRAAIIMTAGLSSTIASQLRSRGVQVVMLNRYSLDLGSSTVACDNVAAGRMVAEAFLQAGRTRVAYVGGQVISSTNLDRKTGFFARLAEAGIEPVLALDGAFTHQWGYEAGAVLARLPEIQAVFCADDDIALGVIDHLRFDCGRRVPEDVAVVGFDDIPGAAWPAYNLTTVRQPIDEMITRTLELLDAPATDAPVHIRLPGEFISRKTF
jgi:DNA-binding LacI/PurR family transcriptional regulator